MHISLSNLLSSVQLPPGGSVRIETLTRLLHEISQAGEEDDSDPFTSTFEALRVMKTTISKLNTVFPPSERSGYSDISPEYVTPVQSQSTSPTRELSPPSAGPTDSMLKGLQALGLADEQSPLSSPNLSGGGSMSSLATHTNKAVRREKTRTLPVSSRSSGPSGGGGNSLESRRLSDSALQRLGIHKVGPEVHSSGRKTTEAFTMDDTVEVAELRQEIMQLRQENSKLVEQSERLKLHSRVQQDTAEREMGRLHAELARYENRVKRMEQEFQETRGKLFKGLNTQTEVALVQLTRDFENMRTQLLAKTR
ncbi:hypothetical protein GBAR_LOCUS16336 [Geodia barretti]|nr:hypothetical protein GBAR_LOCUS16336 [Geodia barretti]